MRHVSLAMPCSKLLVASVLVLVGCSGRSDTQASNADSVSNQSAELEAAQCSLESYDAVAEACKASFEQCIATQGPEACRAELEACLPAEAPRPGQRPPLPPLPPKGGEGCVNDGEGPRPAEPPPPPPGAPMPGAPGGEGPVPGGEPIADGSAPKPPLPPPGAGPVPGIPGPGPGPGPIGPMGPAPGPQPELLAACHEGVRACIEKGEAQSACFDGLAQCVGAAFAADFKAKCDAIASRCASGEAPKEVCVDVAERCAAGVRPPPNAPKRPRCVAN